VKQADHKPNWRKMGGDTKDRARLVLYGTGLNLGSMVPYVIMIYTWFRVYYRSFNDTVLMFIFLLTLASLLGFASRRQVSGIERPWLRWLAAMFAFMTLVGCVAGFFLYYRSLCYYWRYQDLRSYTNVAGSQGADAFPDANMFLWTEDTRLDSMRSVGYRSRWTGDSYCVAPIVDGTMSASNPISYWAVGDGCCSARAEFVCNDAVDLTVRSALVILEPKDVVRPWMQWAVQRATYPRYVDAIALQEATYSTTAAQTVKLVKWVKDPIAAMNAYYTEASWACVRWSVFFFFAQEAACLFIAYKYIVSPQKKFEMALRNEIQP